MRSEDVKLGMTLTVRDDLVVDNRYDTHCLFTKGMVPRIGEKVKIRRIYSHNRFNLENDDSMCCWTFEMFKESQSPQEITISSLIKKVLINDKATIVFFTDETKSVVVHNDNLPYDQEKAIAMAIAKKYLGGYTEFKKVLDSVTVLESKQRAKVTSVGLIYPTYSDFFEENNKSEYKNRWAKNSYYLKTGDTVTIIFTGKSYRGDRICVVEDDIKQLHLIREDGLKFL